MSTTITVNGVHGSRFLSDLAARFSGRIPSVLAYLIDEHVPALAVDTELAEEVAEFVDELIASAYAPAEPEPPLLFSPEVGDEVMIVRDALLELDHRAGRSLPRTWRFVERNTRARVVTRRRDVSRIVLLDGPSAREIAYVSDGSVTGIRFWRRHRVPAAVMRHAC